MNTPRWIREELKLINSMYFAVFNPYVRDSSISYGKGRWQIRKWLGCMPKRLDLWNTDASEVILTICDEQYSEIMGGYDAGYEEIDQRVITAIRKSHYWKVSWKKKVAEIDFNNDELERRANQRLEDESKMVAKRIWHANREHDVFFDGKCEAWK